MLRLHAGISIYVSLVPMDMRKAINGLVQWVSEELKRPVQSGDLFVFVGRSKDRIKILYWDRNGFVLYHKRLEKHQFLLPKAESMKNDVLVLSEAQLEGLLSGLNTVLIEHSLSSNNYELFA